MSDFYYWHDPAADPRDGYIFDRDLRRLLATLPTTAPVKVEKIGEDDGGAIFRVVEK